MTDAGSSPQNFTPVNGSRVKIKGEKKEKNNKRFFVCLFFNNKKHTRLVVGRM